MYQRVFPERHHLRARNSAHAIIDCRYQDERSAVIIHYL